jgi:hypothetical protein
MTLVGRKQAQAEWCVQRRPCKADNVMVRMDSAAMKAQRSFKRLGRRDDRVRWTPPR